VHLRAGIVAVAALVAGCRLTASPAYRPAVAVRVRAAPPAAAPVLAVGGTVAIVVPLVVAVLRSPGVHAFAVVVAIAALIAGLRYAPSRADRPTVVVPILATAGGVLSVGGPVAVVVETVGAVFRHWVVHAVAMQMIVVAPDASVGADAGLARAAGLVLPLLAVVIVGARHGRGQAEEHDRKKESTVTLARHD
jgi:hypothetical protein